MRLTYEVLSNVQWTVEPDAEQWLAGYTLGDRLVRTWSATVDADDVEMAAEVVFVRHNADFRPDGQAGPSLSVGDVVVVRTADGPVALACAPVGFVRVALPANVERRRSWREVTAERR